MASKKKQKSASEPAPPPVSTTTAAKKRRRRKRRTTITHSIRSEVRTDGDKIQSGQHRLDQYRGIDIVAQKRLRQLDGKSRLQLIDALQRRLDSDLERIVPVPKEEWTPIRLAVASGLSVSQVTRVFHDKPDQQRWRHFASDLKSQSVGYGLTADQSARVMALAPGHRYSQPSAGILRLAKAMGISVDEVVEILLSSE